MSRREIIPERKKDSSSPGWKDILAFILAIYSYAVPLVVIGAIFALALIVICKLAIS